MNISLRKSLFAIALFSFVGAFAQGPNNSGTYYSAADGKKGKALKTALSKIIGNPDVVSYNGLISAYQKTDRRDDGKVWDMYSCTTNYNFNDNGGSYKKEGDIYNREHSFPKSWFNKKSPMVSDIVHVVPADGKVNGMRATIRSVKPRARHTNRTRISANSVSQQHPATQAQCSSRTICTRATSRASISTWLHATRAR